MVGRIRAGGGCVKEGGETMILKKGDKLGQVAGALKKGGLEPPYELCKGCWFFE